MREIKFRAWDNQLKKLGSIESVDFKNQFAWFRWYISETRQGNYQIPLSDITLMQFTDLKDKNGKEIYEGDILEIIEENESDHGFYLPIRERRIIEWVDDMFCLVRIDNYVGRLNGQSYCSKCGNWEGLYSENHEMDIGCFSKIIGNIYENPELLK